MAGVGILAVIGYLVISGLLGRGAAGAGTPEEAVKSFVTAVQSKDVAAIAAALDPQELRQFVPLVEQVQKTAQDSGVTHKGEELAGVDLKITNVTYDTKNLSERVARVDLTGGKIAVAGLDKSKLPLALQGLTVDPSSSSLDLATFNAGRSLRPFIMVVKEERGWFVSPLFTGAEALAQTQGVLGSYADTLPTATTEKTADGAVKAFVTAVTSKDPDAVLARLSPTEQSVLRTYDRIWRPSLNEKMGSGSWNGVVIQGSVNKMTDTDLGDGSTAVAIESADLAVASGSSDSSSSPSISSDSSKVSLEKDCLQGLGSNPVCLKSWRTLSSGAGDVKQQGGTSGRATIVAVKTGDGYAVSMLGSVAATSRSALAALDAKEIFRGLDMAFLLPTGGSLGVGQQLTIDPTAADNVTLTVDKEQTVGLKVDKSDVFPQVWNASGLRVGGSYDTSSETESVYSFKPGQYRITWTSSNADKGKITISAVAQ